MNWYTATVRRQRGQPHTLKPFQAPDIRDAAAHIREQYPLHGPDPHQGFKIDEMKPEEASERQQII